MSSNRQIAGILRNTLMRAGLAISQARAFEHFREAAGNPAKEQAQTLRRILLQNAGTTIGRQYGFDEIGDIREFREAVPVHDYEALRPLIEEQEKTDAQCLTAERPVYYNRTSGTVGAPKNIPITQTGLARLRAYQRLAAYAQSRHANVLGGKIFGVTGAAIEGYMPGGTPFGSASGLLYENQSRLIRGKLLLPSEISQIDDYQGRYLAMAIIGISCDDVTCISTANPSTFLKLLETINGNLDAVLSAVSSGILPREIDPSGTLSARIQPDPARARAISRNIGDSNGISIADIWPRLGGVITWTGGSCGIALTALKRALPATTEVFELGYLASEVTGTINIDPKDNNCLPTLLDNVFEFVERDAWEVGGRTFLSLQELKTGSEYYVFITTGNGLYRYDINDIVRVTGWVRETPVLEFVQKGKGVTSITGEKLYEAQVLDSVAKSLNAHKVVATFFIALADAEAAGYRLYLELPDVPVIRGLSDEIDGGLRELNIEYDSKRASGRLSPLVVRYLSPGTSDAYRSARVSMGQRDSQYKYLHLQYAHECEFDFDAYTIGIPA